MCFFIDIKMRSDDEQLAAANVPFKRPSKEDLLTQLKICFIIFNGSQQNHKSRCGHDACVSRTESDHLSLSAPYVPVLFL